MRRSCTREHVLCCSGSALRQNAAGQLESCLASGPHHPDARSRRCVGLRPVDAEGGGAARPAASCGARRNVGAPTPSRSMRVRQRPRASDRRDAPTWPAVIRHDHSSACWPQRNRMSGRGGSAPGISTALVTRIGAVDSSGASSRHSHRVRGGAARRTTAVASTSCLSN